MKRLVFFLFCMTNALAQNKVKTDCNTIYMCIDSVSCKAIFSNAYLKDKFFVSVSQSTTTNNDSYSGNYLIGKSATIEFLLPQKGDKNGDKLGDFGIEFKTRKLNNLTELFEQSKKQNIKLDTLTTKLIEQDTTLNWYKELAFKRKNFELSILEYQKEYLNYLGFSENQMANEMTYEQYNTHLSGGRKYPKQFSKMKSVTVLINKNELQALEQFCLLNQMKKRKKSFYNDDFKINYTISKSTIKSAIKKIEVEFLESQPKQKIQLSRQLQFEVNGISGTFIFNN